MTDKQPEALRIANELSFFSQTVCREATACLRTQHATITAQDARIAELERDAARYRWLRVNGAAPYEPYAVVRKLQLEKLDAAIDAAMQQGEQK